MIKRGKHIIKNHMTLEYEFTGIRLQNLNFTPVEWKLTIDLIATGKPGRAREEIEKEANIVYQKIYFWLDSNLPHAIVVNASDKTDYYLAGLTDNIALYCPESSSDDMLIQLLHAKVAALAGTSMLVGPAHLKGSDTALQYTFDCSNGEYSLPTKTTEYIVDMVCRDEMPWWLRDDGFCFEFSKPADSELTNDEMFGDIVDPMDEFQRVVEEMVNSHISVTKEPAKIVKVEKWQPKIV